MYLKSEKMQNCVSKIRAQNRITKNRFISDTFNPIKIIENFSDEGDNKENEDPTLQI